MPVHGLPHGLPHHYQMREHTCGPASVKMVFDHLWGTDTSEAELADWLASNQQIGTRQRAIARLVERFGFDVRTYDTDTTTDDLRKALAAGHVVIVLYHLADDDETFDHYAVVKQITPDEVVLHDPYLGPDLALPVEAFEALWAAVDGVPGRKDRWAIAVKDPVMARLVEGEGSA